MSIYEKKFEVVANGHSFGVYEADTPEMAMHLCAQDAGYQDILDMERRLEEPSKMEAFEVE